MQENQFDQSVNKLIEQTKSGRVENETAMAVFNEAYKALPTGGSVEHRDERLKFENGPTVQYGIHRDQNKLWLNTDIAIEGPGADACQVKKPYEREAIQCLSEKFGPPISEESKTEFDTGVIGERKFSASRSIWWKNPVTDKDDWTYSRNVGDLFLHRKMDMSFDTLTVTKSLPDGRKLELSFSRPDKYDAVPVRYKGMKTLSSDGSTLEQRSMHRVIGELGRNPKN